MTATLRHLAPALAGFALGAATMYFLGGDSGPVPLPSSPSVPPAAVESATTAASTNEPATLPRAAGEQDREITQLNAAIVQLKREVAQKDAQLALIESLGKGLYDHFTTQIEEDTKQGVRLRSGFESLEETARFMGELSRRSFALRKRFPSPPAPNTPEREEYDRIMAEIMRDSALVLQDTRMLAAFTNGDAKNVALTKALSTSAALGLDARQTTTLQTILESAYGEGFAQKLDQKNKPAKDAAAWQKSRDALARRSSDQVRGLLTPAQREDFDAMGGAGSFWSLSMEDSDVQTALGIDLGGTRIKIALVSEGGEVLSRELRPTNDDGTDVCAFAEVIRALAGEFAPGMPVGLAAPGLAAGDRRAIAHLPGRLHGLERLDWTEFLGRTELVPVTNDAHASLLGEAWIGAARGLRDAILLTLGTGVGGAILAGGRLLRGHIGRAGHFGHVCLDLDGPPSIAGMPGALEVFCGNYNIAERTGGRFTATRDLLAACAAGDAQAEAHWQRCTRALACAIASFINVLDPEAVIIGGGIAEAGDVLFEPLRAELAKVEWRPGGHAVKLLPAALGEWAGAIGAAYTALNPP